jgi:hypothetical protein
LTCVFAGGDLLSVELPRKEGREKDKHMDVMDEREGVITSSTRRDDSNPWGVERLRRFFSIWQLLVVGNVMMVLLCLGFAPFTSAAELVQPFYSRNVSPFVQIYGLPAAEDASLASQGKLETRLIYEIANNYTDSTVQQERIVIRGETSSTVLSLRYGLRDSLEIGVDLPYLSHSEGDLNDFIYDWHDFFGMPQGSRSETADDRLNYRYTQNGTDLVAVSGSASGIGDVLLSAALPLWNSGEEETQKVSVRAALKLPTGSSSDLLGSGSTDFSVRLNGEDRQAFASEKIACFGSLGVLLMTEGDVLPERQRKVVGFGSVGLGWQPLSMLALQLQLDGHSAFYDSELKQLGDFAAQLVIGGTLGLPADFMLDLAVSEDIIVDTAPDVVFHLALRRFF